MPEPTLNRHAELIHRIHREEKTVRGTWNALKAEGIVVAYETLRAWLGRNPGPTRVPTVGKGRPRLSLSQLFRLLPRDGGAISSNEQFPLLFMTFLDCPDDFRAQLLMEALADSGVDVSSVDHLEEILIPRRLLTQLGDLEIYLLTHLLSDLRGPIGREERGFREWVEILTIRASRLKARFREGRDATVAELRAAMRGV